MAILRVVVVQWLEGAYERDSNGSYRMVMGRLLLSEQSTFILLDSAI